MLVGKLIIDTQYPVERPPIRGSVEFGEMIGARRNISCCIGEASSYYVIRLASQSNGDFPERQFRMILYAPEDAAIIADLGGLNPGNSVGRKQNGPRGKRFNLIAVDGGSVPARRPSR